MRIVIATQNPNKVREFAEILGSCAELVPLPPSMPKAPETGETFMENARQKALFYASRVGDPVLADDSGLVVPALGGAPGVRSARYAGAGADDQLNNQKLVQALRDKGLRQAEAWFACAIVVAHRDRVLVEVESKVDGLVHDEPRGEQGFGYDPLFSPQGESRRFAEMSAREKHLFSHRALAVRELQTRWPALTAKAEPKE
ncbi:RdgB/HAM1 family non-canonical purine NTP pyrophosphatase [Alicyclobacillus mali]|uniref:dITP/XTP pyrophosphatase n=1 Tax=Alicyclobacillus mali (ex Roth et al. 2021) TaxID=1123961 RepID=A0ABS0F648_9BACL|nr:RdgB/HAM1 family non-canonical purine NTP pyrophosphatase [Alicyclobacillus mali (ex Roth et al. 2021)]MBF8378771.1 RdgB/HAM1 family non-canonical purine NTP pyrophosphatase [Alicyclobacillus mali (ex Roth et al. 2021)]MCL6488708.1 RdgB/HAM1 family non-canonical purine NTP pyrophosphatase [Alicyclobacillus mali (ex Roth et al. 2021)]